jgi:hypothetical protein
MENGEKKMLSVVSPAASWRYRLAENRLFASGTLVSESPAEDVVAAGDRFLSPALGSACAVGVVVHPATSTRRMAREEIRVRQLRARRFMAEDGKA